MSLRRNQTRSAQNSNSAVAIATETLCILRHRAEAPNVAGAVDSPFLNFLLLEAAISDRPDLLELLSNLTIWSKYDKL